jgi:hypothetical protein
MPCIADWRDAPRIAWNADPDPAPVMKAPWLDHRYRLVR